MSVSFLPALTGIGVLERIPKGYALFVSSTTFDYTSAYGGRMYYHTRTPDPLNDDVLYQGVINRSVELAQKCGSNQMALAFETQKDPLSNNHLKEIIGAKKVKSLLGSPVDLGNITVHLLTKRTKGSGFRRGPIVIVYMNPDFIEDPILSNRATDIIYMPWNDKELKEYCSKYSSVPCCE